MEKKGDQRAKKDKGPAAEDEKKASTETVVSAKDVENPVIQTPTTGADDGTQA